MFRGVKARRLPLAAVFGAITTLPAGTNSALCFNAARPGYSYANAPMVKTTSAPVVPEATQPISGSTRIERIAASVNGIACIWISVFAGSTLLGWLLHNAWLVQFPTPRAEGIFSTR